MRRNPVVMLRSSPKEDLALVVLDRQAREGGEFVQQQLESSSIPFIYTEQNHEIVREDNMRDRDLST